MDDISWQTQNNNKPLYPDVIWNKPENKYQANSILIIGGNSMAFNFVSIAYNYAKKNLFSNLELVLPKSLENITKGAISNCYYGFVNKSGGYGLANLDLFIELSDKINNILLVGNISDSSETHLLFEKFLLEINNNLIIATNDSIELLNNHILTNDLIEFLLILDLVQLQKIIKILKWTDNFKSTDNLYHKLQTIQKFSSNFNLKIITKIDDSIYVFADKKISSTKFINSNEQWKTELSVETASWISYKSKNQYENLTTALFQYIFSGAARRT